VGLNWLVVIKWIAVVMMKKKHSIVSRYSLYDQDRVVDKELEASRTGRPEAHPTSLVGARSLDVTRLLALVADTLARGLRRTVSREMTNFAT
jgi:hypothetical protein